MKADLTHPDRLRRELVSFLDLRQGSAAPRLQTLSSSVQPGYTRHLVHLLTEDDVIPSLLAVPEGPGPFPAVVVFHQHAGQRHLGKSEVFGLAGDPHQAFGPVLARLGFVVLAPDSIAFEDRRGGPPGTDPREDDWQQHFNAFAYRLVMGDTLMRKVIQDAMVAVSALLARPDVQPESITALGHSYGGNSTLFLTAVDERVQRGCASGALASYRRKMHDATGIEMAEVIPGFAARFDMEHLLAAISPRSFLIVSATDDKYAADAQHVLAALRTAHSEAADAFSHLRYVGGHQLDHERFNAIIDWILRC